MPCIWGWRKRLNVIGLFAKTKRLKLPDKPTFAYQAGDKTLYFNSLSIKLLPHLVQVLWPPYALVHYPLVNTTFR